MAFAIRFLPDSSRIKVPVHKTREAVVEIVLDDFSEAFPIPLSFWTKAQYEAQWREGLRRIVRNVSPSCLITGMHDPSTANFIFCWEMWRQGREILFYVSTIFLEEHREHFDPNNPYGVILEYSNVTDDGVKGSEWTVSVEDIRTFGTDRMASLTQWRRNRRVSLFSGIKSRLPRRAAHAPVGGVQWAKNQKLYHNDDWIDQLRPILTTPRNLNLTKEA